MSPKMELVLMPHEKSVLLAPNVQVAFDDPRIRYPALGSVKFDGFRGLCKDGHLFTRNMKPHPNQRLREHLAGLIEVSEGRHLVFDFELYDHTLPDFGAHQSILMAHDAPIPETLQCYIFDCLGLDDWNRSEERPDEFEDASYKHRVAVYHKLKETHPLLADDRYVAVEQVEVPDAETAKMLFECAVEEGYEGLMLRCPEAMYKHGRSTPKQGIIWKFKEFVTDDGEIIEVMQRRKMKEDVERTLNSLGKTERIHTQDSYELDDCVGAFKVRMEDGTVSEINYGRGFDMATRRQHWLDRAELCGKMVEVRHLPHGAKDGIRIGQLVAFRPDKE